MLRLKLKITMQQLQWMFYFHTSKKPRLRYSTLVATIWLEYIHTPKHVKMRLRIFKNIDCLIFWLIFYGKSQEQCFFSQYLSKLTISLEYIYFSSNIAALLVHNLSLFVVLSGQICCYHIPDLIWVLIKSLAFYTFYL